MACLNCYIETRSEKIAVLVSMFIFSWILGGICAYFTYKLYKQRKERFYYTRYGNLSIIGAIASIIYLTMFRITTSFNLLSNQIVPKLVKYFEYTHPIGISLYTIVTSIIFTCMSVRVWMVNYDIRWTRMNFQSSWKSVIDPISYRPQNNFFLRNKARWGNKRFITKVAIIVVCGVLGCTRLILRFLSLWDRFDFDMGLQIDHYSLLCYSFILACFGWQIPAFTDFYSVRTEMIYNPIIILFVFGLYQMATEISTLYLSDPFLLLVIRDTVSSILMAIACLFTTLWVLYRNGTIHGCCYCCNDLPSMNQVNTDTDTRSQPRCKESQSQQPIILKVIPCGNPMEMNDDINDTSLHRTLGSEQWFELFIRHLAAEYSMEILFSLIEMAQLQQFIVRKECISDSDYLPLMDIRELKFHSSVPHSILIHRSDDYFDGVMNGLGLKGAEMTELEKAMICHKIRAFDIYNKYIRIGSEYEINVSYIQRMEVSKHMSNRIQFINGKSENAIKSAINVCELFDDCVSEMLFLLEASHRDFRRVTDINTIKQLIDISSNDAQPFQSTTSDTCAPPFK